jgi:alkylation response protein AidB-like acyl-CoA dehydrogenase
MTRTEEQQELADTLRSLLDKRADSRAVRAAIDSEPGYDAELWQVLCAQVGVAALAVPEAYGGAGASLAETAVALEEVGRSLAPSPLLATSVATAALLLDGSPAQREALLPAIAAGGTATVVVEPPLVLDPCAEVVLVPSEAGLEVSVTAPEPRSALDPALRLGRLDVAAAPSDGLSLVAAALVTAAQVGVAQRGLDMTVAYSKERVQFGRPIGSFQALKHRMADLLVLVEMARSASWAATAAAASYVSAGADDRPALMGPLAARAHAAKAYCSDACAAVAGETVQLHGGIAITWEHDAHLVLKRAHALGGLFGSAREHRAAVAL